MRAISRLSRSGKLFAAVVVAGAAFGIASAVQASIPDASGVVHACYNTSLAHGNPTGALRAIDTAKVNGNCAPWEGAVDLATPQFVTSTVNQTTIMGNSLFAALPGPNNWVIQWTCGGYIATNPTVSVDPPTFAGAVGAPFTIRAITNVEEQTTGTPGTTERIWFNIASTQNVDTQISCVDPRVYGETFPAAARAKPTVTISQQ